MSDIRNLWGEAKAQDAEARRKLIESGARFLYVFFIVIGGLLAFDLYTRPDSIIIKAFGVLAAIGLVLADVTWAWATHYSAAGAQRWTARAFWGASLVIFALNVISEYLHYLGKPLGMLENWYYIGSISTVVLAALGLAWYLMLSPEQKLDDVRAQAQSDAVKAVLRGIEKPDQETLAQFNGAAIQAARELSNQAAHTILGYVTAGKPKDAVRGNGDLQHASTLNMTAEVVERKTKRREREETPLA